MRIISGKFGRRLIKPPKNLPIRPTTDLAKESLFNILNNKTEFRGKTALDLFSGTGSLAYEFVSRGCTHVLAVEQNHACVRFIQQTAEEYGMEELKVIRGDVFRFIKSAMGTFDIIFADPPYSMENIPEISLKIFERGLLKDEAWLIIEHPGEIDLSDQEHFVEHRKYGKVNFSFFQKQN